MCLHKAIKTTAIQASLIFSFTFFLAVLGVWGYGQIASILEKRKQPKVYSPLHYESSLEKNIYPHLKPKEIYQLLLETWGQPYQYNSFSGYKENPRRGRFVNVGTQQFRYSVPQSDWPPDSSHYIVYLFGGSTAFGYGVEDKATVSSFLQQKLQQQFGDQQFVSIYNFGQGAYFSSLENALFVKLVQRGYRPDLVVFLDGLNDFSNFTGEPCVTFTEKNYVGYQTVDLISYLKSLRLVSDLKKRIGQKQNSEDRASDKYHNENNLTYKAALSEAASAFGLTLSDVSVPEFEYAYSSANVDSIVGVIHRLVRYKKITDAICNAFGIQAVFCLHPIASYKYSAEYHSFEVHPQVIWPHMIGYPIVSYLGTASKLFGENFLDLSGIQENQRKNLYVDGYHFSQFFNNIIADEIFRFVINSRALAYLKKND